MLMARFEMGGENNVFFNTIKDGKSVVFTETFFPNELKLIKDTDTKAPLSYLKDGASATVVVALPLSALGLGDNEGEKVKDKNHKEITDAVNAYQKEKGGVCFEFRSLFNGAISLTNLVDKDKKNTAIIPDNGLHDKDCNAIREGIEQGSIIPAHYQSIYRLKNGDCRPIKCYCLASFKDKL